MAEIPGENLLVKMWETLADKGIGGLLRPWQIKREGRAHNEVRRDEILRIAQAERDAADIAAGRKDFQPESLFKSARLVDNRLPAPQDPTGDLDHGDSLRYSPTLEVPDSWKNVTKSAFLKQMRHEINVAKAVMIAEDVLAADTQEPPEKSVDDDWLFRWEEYAGKASNETLQNLWGRILAGEVKSPGQFSLRTLDFLRGLSQSDAELIAMIASFVVNDCIIIKTDCIENSELNFTKYLKLQEMGVLSGVGVNLEATFRTECVNDFKCYIQGLDSKVLTLTHYDASKFIRFNIYRVTSIGQQILKLGSFSTDTNYLLEICSFVESFGDGFSAYIGECVVEYVDDSYKTFRIHNNCMIF